MNFIGRAVAGLEQRLDQVLAVEVESPATTPPIPAPSKDARTKSPPPPSSSPAPGGRMTMQERLVLAMAKKNAGPGGTRSASPGLTPGTSTPVPTDEKKSVEIEREKSMEVERDSELEKAVDKKASGEEIADIPTHDTGQAKDHEKEGVGVETKTNGTTMDDTTTVKPGIPTIDVTDHERKSDMMVDTMADDASVPRISIDSAAARPSIDSLSARPSFDSIRPPNGSANPSHTAEEYDSIISQLREDLELCELRRQEESQSASERIDSLEEKIKYLARDSAEESRRQAKAAGTPLEKEVAKRDERIALLMEEGEKLSKMELKHMNTIKKLRAKSQDDERAAAEANRRREKAEKEAADLRDKAKKAGEAEKRMADRLKGVSRFEVEFEDLKRVRDILQTTNNGLKEELAAAKARADDAENRVQTDALEAERRTTAELRMTLEKLQNDVISDGERHRAEIRTLTSKMEREGERAKSMELELKSELSMLESKTEVLRARAEEVSTGTSGHAHAKLLRQIETLQSQYAIATGNWQGIEASLLSRITGLEKERDDLTKKESDVRKKAREVNLKSKRLEVDLEASTARIRDLEGGMESAQASTTRAQELDNSIVTLKENFEKERISWQKELSRRIEEERQKWEEQYSRSVSPMAMATSHRRKDSTSTTGANAPPLQRRTAPRSNSAEPPPLSAIEPPSAHPNYESLGYKSTGGARRPTLATFAYPTSASHTTGPRYDNLLFRQDSVNSFHSINLNTNVSRSSPSLHNLEDDLESIASPGLLSVSTAGAGPSVQLVERMSAAVRRLESEMAASREELSRMLAQRDEAREEVVKMMSEVEEKRGLAEAKGTLEREVKRLEEVQQTTLEMLGEKSEEVEELRADVQDLKQMYRDLITQTTGK